MLGGAKGIGYALSHGLQPLRAHKRLSEDRRRGKGGEGAGGRVREAGAREAGSEGGRSKGGGGQRSELGGKTQAAWLVVHLTPYTLLLLYFTPSPLVNGNRRRSQTASPWSARTFCSGPWG